MAGDGEGKVIACHTEDEFDAQMANANEVGRLVLIDFMSPGCGPCIQLAPVFADCAKKYPTVLFLEVDVTELEEVARKFGIGGTPTIVVTRNGEIIDILTTIDLSKLPDIIKKYVGAPAASASA